MVYTRTAIHGHKRHGVGTSTYNIWQGMVARCRSPKSKDYARYGGRGITVCESWFSFPNFLADMGERPTGLTLDRRDNNAGYNKENCRWATQQEQDANKRNSVHITAFGETKILAEWVRDPRCTVSKYGLASRLKRMSPEEALTTASYQDYKVTAFGESKSIQQWLVDPRCTVRTRSSLHERLHRLPPEEAIATPRRNWRKQHDKPS
jgi:hypothetical protein